MNSARLAVAVWGVGGHARRRLLPAIAKSASLALLGVCTRDRVTGEATAAASGCDYFESPARMLTDARVDAVIVSTPTGLHYDHGLAVLAAGKHLISEKPLTHSYASTVGLLEIAERAGLCAVSAVMFKYHPQFRRIRSLVRGGALGELRSIAIDFGIPALGRESFRDKPELGGGALLDISCYPLSFCYWMLSAPPVLRAGGITVRPGSRVDTDGWCVMEGDGVVIHCQWGMGRAYQNRAEIWGSDAVLHCNRVFTKEEDETTQLVVYDRHGKLSERHDIEADNAYVSMFDTVAAQIDDPDFRADERREVEWCARLTDEIRAGRP